MGSSAEPRDLRGNSRSRPMRVPPSHDRTFRRDCKRFSGKYTRFETLVGYITGQFSILRRGEGVGSLQRHHLHFDLNNMNSTDTLLQVDSIEQRGRQTRMNIISMSNRRRSKLRTSLAYVRPSCQGSDRQTDDAADHSLIDRPTGVVLCVIMGPRCIHA